MNVEMLWAPFAGLNAADHSANTRLIWLLLGPQWAANRFGMTNVHLSKLCGLDPDTIARARARLVQAPLASCHARPHKACAAIPTVLLTNADMSAGARLLYGQLQGVPNFERESGSFTYATLSQLTGSCAKALRQAVAELVATGWLAIAQEHRKSPLQFMLRNPVATELSARISSIRRKVRSAPHRGEALLREFLNVMVALDEYEENASPAFLLNPFTRELMEFDRYYPSAAVAFEFNGDQHYVETDLATFEETVKQVMRDAAKAFISKAEGIELVIIHPEDLSVMALGQKIPKRLPRRGREGLEPLMAALEGLASDYRERTADERARKGNRPGKRHG